MNEQTDKKENYNPEVYTQEQLDCIDQHIFKYFGEYESVLHEIVSPDIHVDICISQPTPDRDYYTLTTMGMGAHRMNVPLQFNEHKWERAELLIKLPADWEIENKEECWYWPLRWLKIMARLPIEHDTWLGHAHTVPNGEPFADNTKLCTILLDYPYLEGKEAMKCELPDGEVVNFYQMLPLYEEEAQFKIDNGYDALVDLFDDDFSDILDINRKNYCAKDEITEPAIEKKWNIRKEDMRKLLEWDGPAGCFATDRILVDGEKVGYMYREDPDFDGDSGWRFTAGDESDEYIDNADNMGIYHLNTVCNNDPEIIPFLKADYGTAYMRDEDGIFREDYIETRE
ncbi:MAG: DUF2185 domain-containing protein [Dysgonomonas sp.]